MVSIGKVGGYDLSKIRASGVRHSNCKYNGEVLSNPVAVEGVERGVRERGQEEMDKLGGEIKSAA